MTTINLDCRKTIILDWADHTHWNNSRNHQCVNCSQPALLLDDAGRPAHKVCAQAALAALINKQNERNAT